MMKKILALMLVIASASMAMAKVETLDDLKTAKVGVQRGSATESTLREFIGGDAENVSTYERLADIIKALKDGQIEAGVMDLAPAAYFLSGDNELKALPHIFEAEEYGIAFKKGNPLKADVDRALSELTSEGVIDEIFAKYIAGSVDPSTIDYNSGAKNGYLWVGCEAAFPPFEMRTAYGFVGADIEICAAIAKKLDKTLVIADYAYDVLPIALRDGRIDMICSAYTINDERKQTMDFTESYASDFEAVIVLNK